MLHRVQGIVLRTTKYTDNSLITVIYTNLFGLQTYMVIGVHGRTSKVKVNYFRGLMVLEMIATKTEKQKLERITEVTGARSLTNEFDFVKNTIALFLNELLYKTIQEEESNPNLYEFLINTFDILSVKENGAANFHLAFLIKYTKYIGFYPTENYSESCKYFDLIEGLFLHEPPHHINYLDETLSKHIIELMTTKFETCEYVKITNTERKQLIAALLQYYKLHNALINDLSSIAVLEQL